MKKLKYIKLFETIMVKSGFYFLIYKKNKIKYEKIKIYKTI